MSNIVLYRCALLKTVSNSIVAVHGLGGNYKRTWTGANSSLWLRDFLPKQLKDGGLAARVMSFGYDSNAALSRAVTDIDDTAADLLTRLDDARQSPEEQGRHIIFIAHSLGGIIVKKVSATRCLAWDGCWLLTGAL